MMHISPAISVLLIVPIAVFGLQIPLRAAPPENHTTPLGNPLNKDFEAYVKDLLDRFKVPSLTIAIVDGKEIYSAGYGTAVFPDTPATPDTLYYTASTTKSFVAASFTILRDWTRKKADPLRLTDPLHKYINKFRLASDYATLHTTIEDALSHRSGLPRHDFAYGGPNYTFDDLIAALPHLPLTAEPRTSFQYCNIMFMVLSSVLETLAGIPLGTFLKRYVWEPFGMHSTYFSLAEAQEAERKDGRQLARGYYWDKSTKSFKPEPWMDSPIISGAGATISNVHDYANYLSAMLNNQPPISETGYYDLRAPRSIVGPVPFSVFGGSLTYTLGWQLAVYRGHEIYFHDGGVNGFGSSMLYMPSKKWAITMMANTELRSNFIEQIVQMHMLDELLAVPRNERQDLAPLLELQLQLMEAAYLNSTARLYPDRPKQTAPLTRPLGDYTGRYWHPAYRNLTLYLAEAHYPFADKGMVLTGNRSAESVWPIEIQLQHISGEHFVVWSEALPEQPTPMFNGAFKGEFRVAASGRVEAVGVAVEGLMGGDKIWFERVD